MGKGSTIAFRVLSGFLALVLLIAGWRTIAQHFKDRDRVAASSTWPSIEGVVVTSKLREKSERESTNSWIIYYHAYVEYHYEVEGEEFTGKWVYADTPYFWEEEDAQSVVNDYEVDQTVEVFYDPARPRDACLRPGISNAPAFNVLVGIIWIIQALVLIAVGFWVVTFKPQIAIGIFVGVFAISIFISLKVL